MRIQCNIKPIQVLKGSCKNEVLLKMYAFAPYITESEEKGRFLRKEDFNSDYIYVYNMEKINKNVKKGRYKTEWFLRIYEFPLSIPVKIYQHEKYFTIKS